MSLDQVKNFCIVEVSTGYDDVATSIVLKTGDGAKLPDPANGEYNLVWYDSTTYLNPTDDPNVEIVRVTAKSTDTITVARNQEGSGASTKNTADKTYKMILSLTKKMIDDIETAINTKIENVIEDTTPQLGGDLDVNGHKINGSTTDGYLILRGDSGATDDFKLYDDGILDLSKQSAARATRTSAQSIPSATETKVVLDSESYDKQNEFDPATNYRFTATKAGYYMVCGHVYYNTTVADKFLVAICKKNGTTVRSMATQTSGTGEGGAQFADIIYLAANDYIELWTYHNFGVDKDLNRTALAVHKLS